MHFSKCEGEKKNNVCSLLLWHFGLFLIYLSANWCFREWRLLHLNISCWACKRNSKSRNLQGSYQSWKSLQTQKHSHFINLDRNVELLQRWQLAKQIIVGEGWMIGQSFLTWWKGCMGSQAVSTLKSVDIGVVFGAFDLVVIVLFIAVLHGYALHPSFPYWGSGFF